MRFVSPDFFKTLAIPLMLGRDVAESDVITSPLVAVVSESFARQYWPDQNPLGRQFNFASETGPMIGVVGDIRVRGLEQSSEPQVYLPYQQVQDGWFAGLCSTGSVTIRAAKATHAVRARRAQNHRTARSRNCR